MEASLGQRMEKANASPASKEAMIQVEAKEKIANAHQSLISNHRKNLELQDTCFCAQRGELQGKIGDLKKKLAEADERHEAVLGAQAAAEAELASLQEQVGGVTSLVERAVDEANRAREL